MMQQKTAKLILPLVTLAVLAGIFSNFSFFENSRGQRGPLFAASNGGVAQNRNLQELINREFSRLAQENQNLNSPSDKILNVCTQAEFEQAIAMGSGELHLICDIDFKSSVTPPFSHFWGTIDGHDHYLSNLLIVNDETNATDKSNLAVFSSFRGTIKNLKFSHVKIKSNVGTANSGSAGSIVGLIAGDSELSNLEFNDVELEVPQFDPDQIAIVGGLVAKSSAQRLQIAQIKAQNIRFIFGQNQSVLFGGVVGMGVVVPKMNDIQISESIIISESGSNGGGSKKMTAPHLLRPYTGYPIASAPPSVNVQIKIIGANAQ